MNRLVVLAGSLYLLATCSAAIADEQHAGQAPVPASQASDQKPSDKKQPDKEQAAAQGGTTNQASTSTGQPAPSGK